MYGDFEVNEYVVFGLGFYYYVKLLNFHTHSSGNFIDDGNFEMKAGMTNTVIFAKALYNSCRMLLDCKEGTRDNEYKQKGKCY